MRSAKVALVAGLTLTALALAVTLAHAPAGVAGTNKPRGQEPEPLASTRRDASVCQPGETLPQGTTAIRLSLGASVGPRVRVRVSAGEHTITSGEAESAWTGWVVTVPVRPLARTVRNAGVCASFPVHNETVTVFGTRAPAVLAAHAGGRALSGRMSIEYLRPGTRSWASLASTVVRNMGFGRAHGGAWIVLLALALLATVTVLAARFVFTDLR